jgi:hypothetical protein
VSCTRLVFRAAGIFNPVDRFANAGRRNDGAVAPQELKFSCFGYWVLSPGGVSRPKMPWAGTLLCKPGSRLELVRAVHSAVVGLMLSLYQIPGRVLLKQLSCLKTDGACERMVSESFDHGGPAGAGRGARAGAAAAAKRNQKAARSPDYGGPEPIVWRTIALCIALSGAFVVVPYIMP